METQVESMSALLGSGLAFLLMWAKNGFKNPFKKPDATPSPLPGPIPTPTPNSSPAPTPESPWTWFPTAVLAWLLKFIQEQIDLKVKQQLAEEQARKAIAQAVASPG